MNAPLSHGGASCRQQNTPASHAGYPHAAWTTWRTLRASRSRTTHKI